LIKELFLIKKLKMSKLYCVKIVTAFPDYKRPYASCYIEHFNDIESANEFRRKEKREYYESFQQYLRKFSEPVPKDIDNLDEEKAQDYIYSDTYMDMSPFEATLYEISFGNYISSKMIDFPICEKIEGNETSEE
jgi:Lon protease-like protein